MGAIIQDSLTIMK